jgi:hypothetical protein
VKHRWADSRRRDFADTQLGQNEILDEILPKLDFEAVKA